MQSSVLVRSGPGVPHLLQGVVGGVVKGVGGAGLGLEGEHLLLLLIQQRLHILNHDRVPEAMGLQEGFDRLDAGKGHSDVDGRARLGRAPPEVQLGRTRVGTVMAGWARANREGVLAPECPVRRAVAWVSGAEDKGETVGPGQSPLWSGKWPRKRCRGASREQAERSARRSSLCSDGQGQQDSGTRRLNHFLTEISPMGSFLGG